MKQTKNTLIAILGIAFVLSSCKKEEEKENTPLPELEPITLSCNSFQSGNPEAITLLKNRGDGVDYIINCKISVGVDLVIEPGVNIEFTNGSGMEITTTGSVTAVGSSTDTIIFSGINKAKGAWLGILNRSNSVTNRFEYCLIDYAGGGAFNSNGDLGNLILWADSYIRLENTTISNGTSYGINASYIGSSGYDVEITNCTITTCNIPFYGNPNIAHKISGGSFTGNTTDAIRIGVKSGGDKIETAQTWTDLGVPYRIQTSSTLLVRDGTLTIEPGVTVEFENGARMEIGSTDASTLIAVGTPSNPITFTGVTKAAGAWEHIDFHFTKSPLNEISHAIIEYAGNSGSGGAVYTWSKAVVKVTNVTFKDIGTCAIYAAPSTSNPNENLTESDNTTENVVGGYLCGD